MEENVETSTSRSTILIIILLSIVIPVIVAILFFKPENESNGSGWVHMLPHMNAVINGLNTLILILGYVFIKTGNKKMHRNFMTAAFVMGLLFLVSYLLFHYNTSSTIFGDSNHDGFLALEEAERVGGRRNIYLAILLSHVLLAIIVVPFVLFALYFALNDKIDRHKQVVKFTLPVWLYVSITGLIVYWLVSPYYPS